MGALKILANAGKTAEKADGALPLLLGRATPKTQAEIDALATRVARQMNEEHVRAPKKTTNLAGRSLKESKRLQGLDYVVEPTGAAKQSVVYQPRKGDVNVALPGDQTISDSILRRIGDIEGINSVQEGGARYGLGKAHLDEPLFWASGEAPAQMFQNKVTRVADFYDPERVVGQHLAMGPMANNFAMHFADANLRAIDFSKMKPQQMQQFDRLIANGYYKKNAKTGEVEHINFPEWPGIADPEGALNAMRKNSELRKWFNDRMKTPKVTQPLGLPNGRDIEWAITEPALRNMEVNLTGLSAGEMVPGASLTDTAAHRTYDKGIRGTALGHQEVLTPFTLSFPDAAQHIASTQRPQDFTGTIQKVFPHQIVDEQYLDELGRYRDLIKKYTGKKKGGLTLKASGGLIKAQLKALREEFAAKDAVIKAQQALDEKKYLKDIEANTLTPENIQKKVDEQKPQKFDEGGAAFGRFPQMSLKRRKQDREASKNVPVDLARGFVSGVLGAPGDVESLVRMLPGFDEKTILPTSEDIEKRLPFKSDTPVSRAATGAGQIAGGFYTGPGSPFKLIGAIPAAVKHGAEEFAKASAMGVPHVVKPKGGNWLKGNVEQTVAPFKTHSSQLPPADALRMLNERYTPEALAAMPEDLRLHAEHSIKQQKDKLAIDNWIDRNLTNYIKNEMGTEGDPIRKLAEQGILHKDPELIMNEVTSPSAEQYRKMVGGQQMGKSDLAKAWENASDTAIEPIGIEQFSEGAFFQNMAEPWMAKAPAGTRVYSPMNEDIGSALGFDHIVDVLKQDLASGRIRPEQLSKVSMEQAVRRTHEYDQEMAKKMREAAIKQTEGMPVHKEYPEGYRWIELKAPDYNALPLEERKQMIARLTEEAKQKGLSPEDYIEKYPESQLAEALKYEGDTMGHCVGGYCDDVYEGVSRIYSLRDAKGEPHVTVEVSPFQKDYQSDDPIINQFWQKHGREPANREELLEFEGLHPSIIQIKGKQNRAPKEEYLPFVQDFVKSGKWLDIYELQNTGLVESKSKLNHLAIQRMKERGMQVPKYATEDELNRLFDEYLKTKPPGEKRGGMITSLRRNRNKTESVTNRLSVA
jgi:PcfJ-like protein